MRTPISLARLVVITRVKTEEHLQLAEETPFIEKGNVEAEEGVDHVAAILEAEIHVDELLADLHDILPFAEYGTV